LRRLLLAKIVASNHLPGMTICSICKRLVLPSSFCAAVLLAGNTAEIIGSLSDYPVEHCSVSSPCAVERGLPPPWSPDNPERAKEGPVGTPLTLATGSGPTGATGGAPPPTWATTGSGPTGPTGAPRPTLDNKQARGRQGPTGTIGIQPVRPSLATGPNSWREVT
jgi:hypothetical protein